MKMQNKVFFIIFFVFINISCKKEEKNCLNGNGVPLQQTRTLKGFDGITSDGPFDVVLVQDSTQRVELEGDENLLSQISTDIVGSILVVKGRQCIKPRKNIKVTVFAPRFQNISLNGTGSIASRNVLTSRQQQYIQLNGSGTIVLNLESTFVGCQLNGSGVIDLLGMSVEFWPMLTGTGQIRAFALDAQNVTARIDGSGDIQCRVNVLLRATITGTGFVYFRGNPPNVVQDITGNGRLIREPG